MVQHLIRLVPPSLIRWLGQLQYRVPVLRPIIQKGSRLVRQGVHVILHGPARGLRFDPHGSMPGYALGTSEPEEQETLVRYLRSGHVFYDIGANVGFFAILAARLVGTTGKVYAFEPFPQSTEAIRKNAALNGFEQIVEVWQGAVSDRSGVGRLSIQGECNTFRLADNAEPNRSITVPLYVIDELVVEGKIRPPDLVKIDVEGHEVQVLRGMREAVRRYRPVILCEVHWIKKEIETLLAEVFRPLGYRAMQLDGSPLPDRPMRYHLLLVPPERIAPEAHEKRRAG